MLSTKFENETFENGRFLLCSDMTSVFGSVIFNTHVFTSNTTSNHTFIMNVETQLLDSHNEDSPGTVSSVSIIKKNESEYDCENTSTGNARCFYEILVVNQSLPIDLPNLTDTTLYNESVVKFNGKFCVNVDVRWL